MGFIFKKQNVSQSNIKSNNRLSGFNQVYVSYLMKQYHSSERANLELLMKQLQFHTFGFDELLRSGVDKFILKTTLKTLKQLFYLVHQKYQDHQEEDLFNQDILRVYRYLNSKYKKHDYSYNNANISHDLDENLERKHMKKMISHEYCQQKLGENERNKVIILFLIEHYDRLINDEKVDLNEEDYLHVPWYHVHRNVFFYVNHEKISINAQICIHSEELKVSSHRPKSVFIATISLKHFQLNGKWNMIMDIIRRDVQYMKDNNQSCIFIFTDLQYFQQDVFKLKEKKESVDEHWPEFKIGNDYENAVDLMKVEVRKQMQIDLFLDENRRFSVHFADLRNKAYLFDLIKNLKHKYHILQLND